VGKRRSSRKRRTGKQRMRRRKGKQRMRKREGRGKHRTRRRGGEGGRRRGGEGGRGNWWRRRKRIGRREGEFLHIQSTLPIISFN
jgi:hypothetical protein